MASPALAAGGSTSSTSGSAAAAVLTPVVLTHSTGSSLGFGKFTSGNNGGTVVITAAGAGTTTADVAFVPGSTVSADTFSVRGDTGRSIAVSTTGGAVGAGASFMAFTTTPSASTVTLNSSGAATVTVGGTLTVPGNLAGGSYSGSYSVTVTYN